MRTRSSLTPTVIQEGNFHYFRHDTVPGPLCSNPVIESVNYPTPSYASTSFPESSQGTITDELPMHKSEGYCQHYKDKTEMFSLGSTPVAGHRIGGIPSSCHEYEVSGGYLAYTYARPRTTVLYPDRVTVSPPDWDRLSYEALRTMTPVFSKGNQFTNDILELHQIKGLLSPFGKARSLIGRFSNAYLWYMFGVSPMIKSIEAVIDLMRSLRAKIADIRRRAKRLQTRHCAFPIDIVSGVEIPDGDSTLVYSENESEYRAVHVYADTEWIDKPKYHSTLKFRYDVSDLTDAELELRAWGEAMDLFDPLAIVWNAIPFSFVLDWFSNIGDWIEQLLRVQALPIVIEDFSHSVKFSYSTTMYVHFWGDSLIAEVAKGTRSYYERRRTIPSSFTSLEFHTPSAVAASLGAALVGQAVSNRPRPPRIRKQLPYLRIRAGTLVS